MTIQKKTIEDEYKLLSQEEQILLRPDTVIGSVTEQEKMIWSIKDINNFESIKITKQKLKYISNIIMK